MRRAMVRHATILVLILTIAGAGGCKRGAAAVEVSEAAVEHTPAVPRFGVFELTWRPARQFDDPFFALTVQAMLRGPDGTPRRVTGFYYGTTTWKVRFVPDQLGPWTFTYEITGPDGFRATGAGGFECVPSARPGPVRPDPANPFRWVVEAPGAPDRVQPYFPVGLQDCVRVREGVLGTLPVDGEFHRDSSRPTPTDEYLALFGAAGFNLLRFSQKNCSYALYDDLDTYREAENMATDALLQQAQARGFRVMFGLFGYHGEWSHDTRVLRALRRRVDRWFGFREEAILDPDDDETLAKEQRFAAYAVARWGAYVDFWELLNERTAEAQWITTMAELVRSLDPNRHPIGTSWQRPELPVIEINTPHWYESESELESDLRVAQQAARWKAFGKPVIVGEQGNKGMNWDPLSARRMRIRAWTALFEEIGLIFWNTSWSKRGMNQGIVRPDRPSNIYLGPDEREYVRILQDFATRLDAGVRMEPVAVSAPEAVRAYGLRSGRISAAYVVHGSTHDTPVDDLVVTLAPPRGSAPAAWQAECIEPATGHPVLRAKIAASASISLPVPAFLVDVACWVARSGS